VGWLRPRSAHGRFVQAKPKRLFFSVILATHPESCIDATDLRDLGNKPPEWMDVKSEDECYREKFRNFIDPNPPKTGFFAFYGRPTLQLFWAQPTGNSFTPNQRYRWKAETLKVCLLLVWRVCDQAFGRYRPLNGAEKWSRDHHENWKFA